jgi:hypothetical protein
VTSIGGVSNKVAVAGALTANSSVIKVTSGAALGLCTNTLFTYGSMSGSFNPTVVFDVSPVHTASIVNDTVGKKINLLVTNRPPLAGSSFTMNITLGTPSIVPVVGKYAPTDPDGDALTITGVSGNTNGAVAFTGTNITYTATNGTTDSFTYTVSDGYGGTATQTVNVDISATASQAPNQLNLQVVGGNVDLNYALASPASTTRWKGRPA